MTPVNQEFVHDPDNGIQGDCMRACIASLLDLPIAEVPHFLQIDEGGGEGFWTGIGKFCRERGYVYSIQLHNTFYWSSDCVYHIMTGPSPRCNGLHHAVVGRNGKVFFDPHPSKAGLAGDPSKWTYDFLVKK